MSALGHTWPRPDADPEAWRLDAACRGQDPNLFHPTSITQYGTNRQRPKLELKAIAWAREICASCPVGDECETAGATDHTSIRNGKLPEERNPHPTTVNGTDACGTDAGYRAHYRRGDRGDQVCRPCRNAHVVARNEWEERRRGTA